MKKIKIMLMTLIVVAVVGGVLAFKVKNLGFFCSTTDTAGGCTIAETKPCLTFAPPPDYIPNKFCTISKGPSSPCLSVTCEENK